VIPTYNKQSGGLVPPGSHQIVASGSYEIPFEAAFRRDVVQHRHSSHLEVGHFRCNIVKIIILETILHPFAHDLADSHIGPSAEDHGPNSDIAIGDHARQATILAWISTEQKWPNGMYIVGAHPRVTSSSSVASVVMRHSALIAYDARSHLAIFCNHLPEIRRSTKQITSRRTAISAPERITSLPNS